MHFVKNLLSVHSCPRRRPGKASLGASLLLWSLAFWQVVAPSWVRVGQRPPAHLQSPSPKANDSVLLNGSLALQQGVNMAGQQHLPFVCQASGSVLAVEERRPCTACTPLTLARPGDTQEMVFTVKLLSLSLRVRGEVGHAILTQIFSSVCLAWRGVTYHPFLEHHSLLLTFKSISPLFRVVQLSFRTHGPIQWSSTSFLLVVALSLYCSPYHLSFRIKRS